MRLAVPTAVGLSAFGSAGVHVVKIFGQLELDGARRPGTPQRPDRHERHLLVGPIRRWLAAAQAEQATDSAPSRCRSGLRRDRLERILQPLKPSSAQSHDLEGDLQAEELGMGRQPGLCRAAHPPLLLRAHHFERVAEAVA